MKLRVTCFLDSRNLRLGDDWDLPLRRAQAASRATVVLASPKCDQAYYQREEVAAAIAMARADSDSHRVIALYISDLEVLSVPYGLRVKHGMYLIGEVTLEGREATRRSGHNRGACPEVRPHMCPIASGHGTGV